MEQGTTFTVGTDLRLGYSSDSKIQNYGTVNAGNVYIGKDSINTSIGTLEVYTSAQLAVTGDLVVSGERTYVILPPTSFTYIYRGRLTVSGGVATASTAKLGGRVLAINSGSISADTVYVGMNADVEVRSGGTITSTGDWFIAPGATFTFELNSGLLTTAAILGNGTLGTVVDTAYTTSTAAPTGINLNLFFASNQTFAPGDVLKLFDDMPFAPGAVSSPVVYGSNPNGYEFAVITDGTGLSVQVIPEPGTYALFGGVGAVLLALGARWRRRQK